MNTKPTMAIEDKLSLLASMALKTETQHAKVGAASRMEQDFVHLLGGCCSPSLSPPSSLHKKIHRGPPKEIIFFRNDDDKDVDIGGSVQKKSAVLSDSDGVSASSSHFQQQQSTKKRKTSSSETPPLIISNDEDDSLDCRRIHRMERPPKLAKGVYFYDKVVGPKPSNPDFMMARTYTSAGSFISKCVPLVHPTLWLQKNGVGNSKVQPICRKLVSYTGGVSQN